MPEHSAPFVALRDAILDDLDDDDRRRLGALLGTMTEPQSPLSPALLAALRELVALERPDQDRLSAWCNRYLTRWGQVPVAASRRLKPPSAGSSPQKPRDPR